MALRSRARSTRLLVVALVSISLVTITVDYRQGDDGALSALGDTALVVISPLQEAVSKVTRPIGNFFSTLVRLPSIRHERDVLRDRVSALETQLAETQADQTRLLELEALLGLETSLGPKVETVAAQVIANGVSNFEWTITIDQGSSDGIAEDMPVIASAGLVGHVLRVGPDSSVVQLIIDPDSFVAGRLDVSRQTGLPVRPRARRPADEPGRVHDRGHTRRARGDRRLPHPGGRPQPVSAERADRHRVPGAGGGVRDREVPDRPARGGLLDALARPGRALAWRTEVGACSVRRALLLAAVILSALLLQTTVFAEINLLGAKPELMYLLTISFGILEGPASGAITGFAGGMAQDFLLDSPKGITALTLTLLGYAVGMVRQFIVTPSPLTPVLLVAGGTFVGVVFHGDRFVPARAARHVVAVPVPGGAPDGRVQRDPHAARVPVAPPGRRGIPVTPSGSLVMPA